MQDNEHQCHCNEPKMPTDTQKLICPAVFEESATLPLGLSGEMVQITTDYVLKSVFPSEEIHRTPEGLIIPCKFEGESGRDDCYCEVKIENIIDVQKSQYSTERLIMPCEFVKKRDCSSDVHGGYEENRSSGYGLEPIENELPAEVSKLKIVNSLDKTLPQFVAAEQPNLVAAEIEVIRGNGCLYAKDSVTNKQILLSNFDVTVSRLRQIVKKHGNGAMFADLVVLCGEQHMQQQLSISASNLDNVVTVIKKKLAFCYVSQDIPKAANRIVDYIRQRMGSVSVMYEYVDTGWFSIGGKNVFLHDGLNGQLGASVIVNTGMTIERMQMPANQSCEMAFNLLKLSNDLSKILPLFLFAHTALLYSLFKEAGFTPTFLLFVNGATGSLKTAVSLLMFTFFNGSEPRIPATFKDTQTAIEVKMSCACDSVLLVDDFHPATTSREKAELDSILERVIRFYGDGVGKSRGTNDLGLTEPLTPQGMCAITGEDSSGSQSSLLRCLMVEVYKNTFDAKLLATFQNNPKLWTSHISDFLGYIGSQYPSLVQHIKSRFEGIRDEASTMLKERRSAQTVATLMITAEILLGYRAAMVPGILFDQTAESWKQVIMLAVRQSESSSVVLNPATMFLVALQYYRLNGKLLLAASSDDYKAAPMQYVGYVHSDNRWHLDPKKAHDLVQDYWRKQQGFALVNCKMKLDT